MYTLGTHILYKYSFFLWAGNFFPGKGVDSFYDYLTVRRRPLAEWGPVPAPPWPLPGPGRRPWAHQIFRRHNQKEEAGQLHLKFDSLISHDITYVGILDRQRPAG